MKDIKEMLQTFSFPIAILMSDGITISSPHQFSNIVVEYLEKFPETQGEFIYQCYSGMVATISDARIGVIYLDQHMLLLQKNDFMLSLGHEIKTPLAGILGMLSILLDTELSSEQVECVDTIKESSVFLIGIINNLLDYVSLQLGTIKLEQKMFDLQGLIDSCNKIVSPESSKMQLDVGSIVDKDVPSYFIGDEDRIKQILINLLQNSIRYNYPKGTVKTCVKYENGQVVFNIIDSGKGIDNSLGQHAQLFHTSPKNHYGAGVGLLIVKRLVDLMKGSIKLVSTKLGKGTNIQVNLPLESREPIECHSIQANFIGKSVFIIDDNKINRMAMIQLSRKWGFKPSSCESGAEALMLLPDSKVDIIFLDMLLGDESSTKIAVEIKKILPNTPIILLTSMCKSHLENIIVRDDEDVILNDLYVEIIDKPIVETFLVEACLKALGVRSSSFIRILVLESNVVKLAIWKKYLHSIKIFDAVYIHEVAKLSHERYTNYDLILVDEFFYPHIAGKTTVTKVGLGKFKNGPIMSLERNVQYAEFDTMIRNIIESRKNV